MLLFRSEESINDWCHTHQMPRGQSLTLDEVWTLSQQWYGNRLDLEYTSRTAEQVVEIFKSVGLSSTFWQL